MKILVINPNTSESMTDHLRRELDAVKRPTTQLTVVNPDRGPVSIESAYDEAFAVPPTLELVKRAEQDGYEAVVLACFSDPGSRRRASWSRSLSSVSRSRRCTWRRRWGTASRF